MTSIDDVLERLVKDPDFRDSLAANPEAALEGYDLSPDDLEMLAGTVSGDAGDSGGMEGRKSKSALAGTISAFAQTVTPGGGLGEQTPGAPEQTEVIEFTAQGTETEPPTQPTETEVITYDGQDIEIEPPTQPTDIVAGGGIEVEGTEVEGTTVKTYPNGVTVRTEHDGTEITTYPDEYDALDSQGQPTRLAGATQRSDPDGTFTTIYADGTSRSIDTYGTTTTYGWPGGTTMAVQVHGPITVTEANGANTWTFPAGSTTWSSGGVRTVTDPDSGMTAVIDSDGGLKVHWPEGGPPSSTPLGIWWR